MPNVKPVTDLENYSEVLKDVTEDSPVVLTMDGRDRYVIMDMREYKVYRRQWAEKRLFEELAKGEESVRKYGWLTEEEVERELGLYESSGNAESAG